jgi:quercetin dioxygenase-like cupin family protein
LSVDERNIKREEKNVEDTTSGTTIYVPPGEGKSYWTPGGHMATFKATSEDTGGAYTITEDTFPPQVGPPPHIHHTQEETFYVLEGEMEFITDGVTTRAAAGSLVRIPRGVLRDYKNVGSEPARVLVLFAPGGFEGFFAEVGELVTGQSAPPEDPPDVERLVAAAAKHGCEIPPPPQE